MLVNGSIDNYDYGLDGLGFSLKPPKFVRKAAAAVGRVIAKVAPIVSVASLVVPGVGPLLSAGIKAVGAAIPGAGLVTGAVKAAQASKLLTAARTATNIVGAARPIFRAPDPPPSSAPTITAPASPVPVSARRMFGPVIGRPIFKAAPVGTPPGTPGTVLLPGTDTPILTVAMEQGTRRAMVPMIPGNTAPISLVPTTDRPGTSATPPGRVMVPVDSDLNPISNPSPDIVEAIADAAARVVNNAASNVSPPAGASPLQPMSPLSPYGSAVMAPVPGSGEAGSFSWLPVLAVGGGLWLLSQGSRRRAA